MHRCLLLSDILYPIIQFIQQDDELLEDGTCNDDPSPLGKQTLASLARTCRAFTSPALDMLWTRLDSLDPLIKLLPSRIWSKEPSRFVVCS